MAFYTSIEANTKESQMQKGKKKVDTFILYYITCYTSESYSHLPSGFVVHSSGKLSKPFSQNLVYFW